MYNSVIWGVMSHSLNNHQLLEKILCCWVKCLYYSTYGNCVVCLYQELWEITAVTAGSLRSCFPHQIACLSWGGTIGRTQQTSGPRLCGLPQDAGTWSLHSSLSCVQPLAYRYILYITWPRFSPDTGIPSLVWVTVWLRIFVTPLHCL